MGSGALEVGAKALVGSREGPREAGLHVGSCGMASWLVQGHTWRWGFIALRNWMRLGIM